MNYRMPDAISGDTFDGVRWTVLVNGSPLDLTSALITMNIKVHKKITVFSTAIDNAKLQIVNPPTSGIFELPRQIITLSPGNYSYETIFYLSGGLVKTYLSGNWLITEN